MEKVILVKRDQRFNETTQTSNMIRQVGVGKET